MGDLSPHLSRSEVRCPCGCGLDTMDHETVMLFEAIRTHFDRPTYVSEGGGCRCEPYNRSINGAPNSQHLVCRALDITVEGIPASLVQELCDDMGVSGLGSYENFTHIDTRTGKARW